MGLTACALPYAYSCENAWYPSTSNHVGFMLGESTKHIILSFLSIQRNEGSALRHTQCGVRALAQAPPQNIWWGLSSRKKLPRAVAPRAVCGCARIVPPRSSVGGSAHGSSPLEEKTGLVGGQGSSLSQTICPCCAQKPTVRYLNHKVFGVNCMCITVCL